MIKALMIITMVSGGEYRANLPSMNQCLEESDTVESQNNVESVSCIPRWEECKTPYFWKQDKNSFIRGPRTWSRENQYK